MRTRPTPKPSEPSRWQERAVLVREKLLAIKLNIREIESTLSGLGIFSPPFPLEHHWPCEELDNAVHVADLINKTLEEFPEYWDEEHMAEIAED